MRFSEAKSHKVMSAATATTVAKVKGFVVDAPAAAVVALRVGKSDAGEYLHWPDVTGFGPDAVVVADEDKLTEARGRAAQLLDKRYELVGKRVLDDHGDAVGEVEDVEFDPSTGRVLTLFTSGPEVAGDRMVGCGSWALVVRAAPPEPGEPPVAVPARPSP